MKLGICIPYYENTIEMKEQFGFLLDILLPQLNKEALLVIIVNGIEVDWVDHYKRYNVQIIHQKEANVSMARNKGIIYLKDNKCSHIVFIDADDSISCDYLSEITKAVIKSPDKDMFDSRFIWNGYETWGTRKTRNQLKNRFRGSIIGTVYNVSYLGDIMFDEKLKYAEDVDFNTRLWENKTPNKENFGGIYVYNKGVNPDSLVMRHMRGEKI